MICFKQEGRLAVESSGDGQLVEWLVNWIKERKHGCWVQVQNG